MYLNSAKAMRDLTASIWQGSFINIESARDLLSLLVLQLDTLHQALQGSSLQGVCLLATLMELTTGIG
ncbi:hypothetical protein CPL00134L_CDS0044 [Escherichia phage Phagiculus]